MSAPILKKIENHTFTLDEYDLINFCLEQMWSDFNDDEVNDAENIMDKIAFFTDTDMEDEDYD